MTERVTAEVDDYLAERFVGDDAALRNAIEASERAGLPPIAVSATQGKLLHILARSIHAKRALEIGTLGGYSAIWIARALGEGGRLITLEIDPTHADVARRNIADANLADRVEVRIGRALDTLSYMERDGVEPFDFIFIDADKQSNPAYLTWALRYSRPGTLIVVDNVVRGGAVLDSASGDLHVRGTRDVLEMLASDPHLCGTAIQTVGHKGYDGFAIALVTG